MSPQEYYLDISTGRFLDGESLIPTNKPSFYADEKKTVSVNVLEVKRNIVRIKSPSKNARYRARLGTSSQKLADFTDVTTAPAVLITAQASVVTKASAQATGLGTISTYSPVTATFVATVTTRDVVTASLTPEIFYIAPVTATVTASISTATQFVSVTNFALGLDGISDYYGSPLCGHFPFRTAILSFTPTLNSPVGATFTSTISGGSVTTISILNSGSGYPNGVYGLSFAVGTSTTTASAEATASNGKITSISIVCGGIGYTTAPAVTIFTADKQVVDITPTNPLNIVNGNRRFYWAYCKPSVTPPSASLVFSAPDTTSTVTNTSVPSASIVFIENTENGGVWELRRGGNGYGYLGSPSVTHSAVTVARPIISHVLDYKQKKLIDGRERLVFGIYYDGRQYEIQDDLGNLNRADYADWESVRENSYGLNSYFVKLSKSPIYGETPNTANAKIYRILNLSSEILALNKSAVPIFSRLALLVPYLQAYDIPRKSIVLTSPDKTNIVPFSQDFPTLQFISKNSTKKFSDYSTRSFGGTSQYLTINGDLDSGGQQLLARITAESPVYDTNIISSLALLDSLPNREGNETPDVYFTKTNIIDRFSEAVSYLAKVYSFGAISNISRAGLLPSRDGAELLFSNGFLPKLEILDFGNNYISADSNVPDELKQGIPSRARVSSDYLNAFQPIGYLSQGYSIIQSPVQTIVTIPSDVEAGFRNTIYSTEPTVATRLGNSSVEYFIDSGGFGYTQNPFAQITSIAPTTPGVVISAKLTNSPQSYVGGQYDCVVQAPPSGVTAKVKLVILNFGEAQGYSIVIQDSGSGYTSAPIITAVAPNRITGNLTNMVIANNPKGYEFNGKTYPIEISNSPVTGGSAAANLNFYRGQLAKRVFDVAPISRAGLPFSPNSNIISSSSISGVLPQQGYKTIRKQIISRQRLIENGRPALGRVLYNISGELRFTNIIGFISGSEVAGEAPSRAPQAALSQSETNAGFRRVFFCEIYDEVEEVDSAVITIAKSGVGYVTAPTVTAPAPDTTDWGKIQSIRLTNRPVGYIDNTNYQLTIESSPSQGGSALASFNIGTGGIILTNISNAGYGYTSAPIITAQGPNAPQGLVVGATVTTLGSGYAPGVYECSVTTAPTGGRTANAIFSINDSGAGVFQIADSGEGYVTAPAISVVTPAGNSIQSVTITCAGSYYDETDAIFNLVDASGQGCVFGSPLIVEGKINDLPVIRSGYGYSNNPQIQFFAPLPPAPITIPANQVLGVVSISAASANAILTTANSRDITLEIYETNGVDEQVVAQAVVNLAKRVLE